MFYSTDNVVNNENLKTLQLTNRFYFDNVFSLTKNRDVSCAAYNCMHVFKYSLNVPRYKSLFPATLPILACHLPCWWCLYWHNATKMVSKAYVREWERERESMGFFFWNDMIESCKAVNKKVWGFNAKVSHQTGPSHSSVHRCPSWKSTAFPENNQKIYIRF